MNLVEPFVARERHSVIRYHFTWPQRHLCDPVRFTQHHPTNIGSYRIWLLFYSSYRSRFKCLMWAGAASLFHQIIRHQEEEWKSASTVKYSIWINLFCIREVCCFYSSCCLQSFTIVLSNDNKCFSWRRDQNVLLCLASDFSLVFLFVLFLVFGVLTWWVKEYRSMRFSIDFFISLITAYKFYYGDCT